jgi:hypothetical protein
MTCTNACRIPSGNGAHCGRCHQSFGAVSTFDAHLTGPVDSIQCLDPATAGMHQDAFGSWRRDATRPHPHARPHLRRTPETADQPPVVVGDTPGTSEPAETLSGEPDYRRWVAPVSQWQTVDGARLWLADISDMPEATPYLGVWVMAGARVHVFAAPAVTPEWLARSGWIQDGETR